MKKILSFLLIFCVFFQYSFALEDHVEWPNWVDVTVSPTRYELNWWTWQTVTKPIKVINNSEFAITFTSSKENCRPKDTTGTPDCSVHNDFVDPNTQLSSWLSLSDDTFTVPWNSEKDVTFTVNIPSNASPGSHFWAVFFSSGVRSWHIISTEKRIWVLILLNVDWDTVTHGNVENVTIAVSSDGWWWANGWKKISWDILSKLKQTVFTAKEEIVSWVKDIVDNISPDNNKKAQQDQLIKEKQKNEKLQVDFNIDFVNTWNTHIKPQWKIVISDNGVVIPKIGQEEIKNENDAIIGEKITDYIPINDEGWNALPNSKRTFEQQWSGFPYLILNEKWEREIKYRTFSEYFSNKNLSERQLLMFWEQVKLREKIKKLTAKIELWYTWEDGKEQEFNSAKDFNISYTEQYVWYNWFVVIILACIWLLLFWWILFALKRRKKEDNEIKRLKKRLKEQEKELDKIEDMVEDIPWAVAKRVRKKVDDGEKKTRTRKR